MRITRFYFEDYLETGSIVKLNHDLIHYVVNVLRLVPRNQIKLFNNKEGEFFGTIVSIDKDGISVSVDLQIRVPSEDSVRFHIALSITKGERMDYAIQKSVELGVSSVTPLYSQFSEVKIKNKNRLRNKLRHWEKVILNASQQCGRLSLPQLREPMNLPELIEEVENDTFILLDTSGSKSLHEVKFKRDLYLGVGPEGGFSDEELKYTSKRAEIITLGPRTLRSETAPIVALSILQSKFGDLL
tara:strand:+ start:724 stop:1452 length:729 start_codon:yes stop_codon:yes gene_type:complete